MADGGSDYSLMSSLRSSYPSVPLKVVLKIIETCKRDQERCMQALELEKVNYPPNEMNPVPTGNESVPVNNDVKAVSTRIKELQVSHEPMTAKPSIPERHVSTIERSIGNIARTQESKGPVITKSVSYSGPSMQFSTGGTSHPTQVIHTAPTDFTPFQGIQNPTSIPNITCKTFNNGSSPNAVTSQSTPKASSSNNINKSVSSSVSPGEQKRPVKVINIPAGTLSGGSVSPAVSASNSRHFRMHFGDTGGTCTVQTNPPTPTIQRYGSTPNVSQHFRSELRTEASVPQSVHSASIVVSTSSHQLSHSTPGRKLSGEATTGEVGRPANPFHFLPSGGAEYQPSPGAYVREDGYPLSTPVQASSPGIAHSRPVFINDFNIDYGHPSRSEIVYPSVPTGYNYLPHVGYASQIGSDYPSSASYSIQPPSQEQNYPSHFNQPKQNQSGYHSPPSNLNTPYNPSSFTLFNPPAAIGYPVQIGTAQPPHLFGHGHFSLNLTGMGPNTTLPKSPIPRLSNRTSSSESDHQELDPRVNHYSTMGSRVSSQSSVGSDSSVRGELTMEKSRIGSVQEESEADYLSALLQHQRNRLLKLKDNTDNYRMQLSDLRNEVNQLERGAIDSQQNKHRTFPSAIDITRLCGKNRDLQTDIQLFVNEIEMYKSGHTPFNNINPREQQNFYANMPTGQQDCNFVESNLDVRRTPSPSRSPPPRPPPPIPVRQRSTEPATTGASDLFSRVPPAPPPQPTTNSGDSEEGEQWSCPICTFQNHPALKKCEMCESERCQEVKPQPRGFANSHLPSTLPHRPPATTTAEWLGGMQHRPGHQPHQHHRAGT